MQVIVSDQEILYYRDSIKRLLLGMELNVKYYTFTLEKYGFKGDRPKLRKILWHLARKGFVKNIDLGSNIHQWQRTDKEYSLRETYA